MRIIAGTRARRKILAPSTFLTRPITDRVKESLFSILQPHLGGAVVADLFCGTGSLGLEALSRGAEHALMVDNDPDAIDRLRRNIADLGFAAQATVICSDVFTRPLPAVTLDRLSCATGRTAPLQYDLVFLDPPYSLSADASAASMLADLLCPLICRIERHANVIVRHARKTVLLDSYQSLRLIDRREYGSMALSFLEKTGD